MVGMMGYSKSLLFSFVYCAVDMLSFVKLRSPIFFRIFLVLEGKHEDTCGFNFVEGTSRVKC